MLECANASVLQIIHLSYLPNRHWLLSHVVSDAFMRNHHPALLQHIALLTQEMLSCSYHSSFSFFPACLFLFCFAILKSGT